MNTGRIGYSSTSASVAPKPTYAIARALQHRQVGQPPGWPTWPVVLKRNPARARFIIWPGFDLSASAAPKPTYGFCEWFNRRRLQTVPGVADP